MSINVADHDAFAQAFERSFEDTEWRVRAISDGLALARHLSWDQCARKTAEIYRRFA